MTKNWYRIIELHNNKITYAHDFRAENLDDAEIYVNDKIYPKFELNWVYDAVSPVGGSMAFISIQNNENYFVLLEPLKPLTTYKTGWGINANRKYIELQQIQEDVNNLFYNYNGREKTILNLIQNKLYDYKIDIKENNE